MPDFIPEPVAKTWRDAWHDKEPTCRECGHPLWAKSSVECGVCSACRPNAAIRYEGPAELRIVP